MSERIAGVATPSRLALQGITCGYGKSRVLHEVSLTVGPGEIVTVLGHNGAGKSTLLKAAFGLMDSLQGKVQLNGDQVAKASTAVHVRKGMSFTPAEAPIFRELSVRENLALGAFTVRDAKVKAERLDRVYGLLPLLKERASQIGGNLSGGQQRMVSIGMALMSGADTMLLDEPSLGIAPSLVAELFGHIKDLSTSDGLSVLLVEQNVGAALKIADRAYYLQGGRIILEESAEASRARDHYWDLF